MKCPEWNGRTWGTHRRHSAQDTGTRPGFRRCLGGGSRPCDEPEPCAADWRVVCTAEGTKAKKEKKKKDKELAPADLLSMRGNILQRSRNEVFPCPISHVWRWW